MSDAALLELRQEVAELRAALPVPENFGVGFIAAKIPCSPKHLYANPWLLPDFGRTEVPGKLLWSLRTIRAWLEVPMTVHQADWDALPNATKKAITDKRPGRVRRVGR
jgi:hypothetical protein